MISFSPNFLSLLAGSKRGLQITILLFSLFPFLISLLSCVLGYEMPVYTIEYHANGGSGNMEKSAHELGKARKLNKNAFSRSGYTFVGWSKTRDGEAKYADEQRVTDLTKERMAVVALYAVWDLATYTVTYNLNSGIGTTPNAQTVNAGNSVILASGSGLSRSGYTFGGWNTNASGTGTNYTAGATYTPTASITLYAKWDTVVAESFTITFAQIEDFAPDITGPTLRLVGSVAETVKTITVETPAQYDSIQWFFNGNLITGSSVSGSSGETLSLNSTIYNKIGTYFITVGVVKDGRAYSKRVSFAVTL